MSSLHCESSESRICGAEDCLYLKNRLRFWNWLPLSSWAGKWPYKVWGGGITSKIPFYLEVFVTHTFFSIEKTIQPLFILSTFPFKRFFASLVMVVVVGVCLSGFLIFQRAFFILYRLFPSSLVFCYGADVIRDFKYLFVQSSSLLILLSVSTHSILKKSNSTLFLSPLADYFYGNVSASQKYPTAYNFSWN